jgi:hypothetical protein
MAEIDKLTVYVAELARDNEGPFPTHFEKCNGKDSRRSGWRADVSGPREIGPSRSLVYDCGLSVLNEDEKP